MKRIIYFIFILTVTLNACHSKHTESTEHEHSESCSHEQPATEPEESAHEHDHGDITQQIIAYSNDFELFAEASPLVIGEKASILAHFSSIKNFKPLEQGTITARLSVNGKEVHHTLTAPEHKGIYRFEIEPEVPGSATLTFHIQTENETYELATSGLTVYSDEHDAIHEAEEAEASIPGTNTIAFTKEQSWKIDFATELPTQEAFGPVIKTTAKIQSLPSSERIITARTNGTVLFSSEIISEGKNLKNGQTLFAISPNGLADNNIAVRFAEATNNFEAEKADYERKQSLAKEKIVSDKDLAEARNRYENAKAVYNNLKSNFNSSGQTVSSPLNGYIKEILVENGQYVEAGQALLRVAQNQKLMLRAEVSAKYATALQHFNTAIIRTAANQQNYTLDELNGKLVSVGQSAEGANFLIPVVLQIENPGQLIPGGFTELFLKTTSDKTMLTVPNSALLEEQGIYFVLVQVHPELFEKREIKTGATDGLRTVVLQGLSLNERIISQGAKLVKLSQVAGSMDPHAGHVH